MRVLICGGGAIGASIAYYLSRRGVRPLVIERTAVACAASGKSGGFLALDWCDGTPLQELARRSFTLHTRLAEEIAADWGFRRLTTYDAVAGRQIRKRLPPDESLAWLSPDVSIQHQLGSTATTAQVHPGQFTRTMMQQAIARGGELRIARVTGVVRDRSNTRVIGVAVDGEVVEGDAVVIAMGPWSVLAATWLSLPGVFGLKGHSLVFATGTKIPAQALFVAYREPTGGLETPEIFPRPDGTTYVCAISSERPLPEDPARVEPEPAAIERLEAMCHELSPTFRDSKILARQACYRPVAQDGLPLIGAIAGLQGAYVATGHSVWGILNAPATGEAMAELITDGATRAVELSAFDPGRLSPFVPTRRAN